MDQRRRPDLILVSGGGFEIDSLALVLRVREHAELGQDVPAVIFCVDSIAEGAEVHIGNNIYATRPDNFDQLRTFLHRLLDQSPAVLY
jgi:DNA-binding response OmpR family regulator